MPKSIASQSHCFADWSFIVEWSHNIVHVCKGLWKLPICTIVVNDPNVQELDHSRARVNDLQKAQEQQPEEITRISKELESFEPIGIPLVMVHYWLLLWEHERTALIFPIPTQTPASQSGQTKSTKADRLIFTFWCSWFVSLLQERDECSEVSPMHALEEKYKAEMSQLAKDSQVVSSFKWERCNIAIGRSMALFGTFRIKRNICVLLASNIQQW